MHSPLWNLFTREGIDRNFLNTREEARVLRLLPLPTLLAHHPLKSAPPPSMQPHSMFLIRCGLSGAFAATALYSPRPVLKPLSVTLLVWSSQSLTNQPLADNSQKPWTTSNQTSGKLPRGSRELAKSRSFWKGSHSSGILNPNLSGLRNHEKGSWATKVAESEAGISERATEVDVTDFMYKLCSRSWPKASLQHHNHQVWDTSQDDMTGLGAEEQVFPLKGKDINRGQLWGHSDTGLIRYRL